MDEKSEFLLYLYQLCEMGISSTKKLLNILNKKENAIKVLIGEQLKEYEDAFEKTKELLAENEIKPQSNNIMTKVSSSMGISFEVMMDNSDSKIADLLTQGYTMGLLEITKKIKKYKNYISGNEKKLAEEIKKFHEKNIQLLKQYL